jgi:hypothetical protein
MLVYQRVADAPQGGAAMNGCSCEHRVYGLRNIHRSSRFRMRGDSLHLSCLSFLVAASRKWQISSMSVNDGARWLSDFIPANVAF